MGHTWSDMCLHLRLDDLLQLDMYGGGERLRHRGDELVLPLSVNQLLLLQDLVQPLL